MAINEKAKKEKYIVCGSGNKTFEIINPLEENPRVKGKKLDLCIVEEPDGFSYIYWKKKKYQVDILEKNQNSYTIMINGVWYSFTIETPISYKRRKYLAKNAATSKLERLNAPMPGKILDILVEENAEVKQGEALIILEAMKMQNEIVSHVSGRVKKISVKKNDLVMKDDIMLEIERT